MAAPLSSTVASFPTAKQRKEIEPAEWNAYLESWDSLLQKLLALSLVSFNEQTKELGSTISGFLRYFLEKAALRQLSSFRPSLIEKLRRRCFFVIHRFFTEANKPPNLILSVDCLADLCIIYARVPGLDSLLSSIWRQENLESDPAALESKAALVRKLEVEGLGSDLGKSLYRVAALLRVSMDYGRFLMQGSDFLDALNTGWSRASASVQQKISKIAYRSLLSLAQQGSSNLSLLLDHLHSLKADLAITSDTRRTSLLVDILSNTPFSRNFQRSVLESDSGRAKSMQAELEAMRSRFCLEQKACTRAASIRNTANSVTLGYRTTEEAYTGERASFVQLKELFPELSDSSIASLLSRFGNDLDMVITHLLEGSLPVHSKTEQRQDATIQNKSLDASQPLTQRTKPLKLPTRRNIFDDDDLSNLNIPESHLHQGRREKGGSLSSTVVSKEAILSALAAIDTDSDERDDTYDVGDVGGTIDITMQVEGLDRNEAALFAMWKSSPQVFARDAGTRRSEGRKALRKETGMTDEAIEGWGVMLRRDPKKIRRLEDQSSTFTSEQNELQSTAWKPGQDDATERSDEDDEASRNMRGGHRMTRGRRPDGRPKGIQDTATPAGPSLQRERHRKDVHKGSQANHNRKNQSARKVARAAYTQ